MHHSTQTSFRRFTICSKKFKQENYDSEYRSGGSPKALILLFTRVFKIFFEVQKQDEDTQQQTILYRSEVQKWSQKIVFRHFSLQSTDMTDTNVEFICYFRDSKNPRGLLGKFETNYELLKTGNSVDNTYFVSYNLLRMNHLLHV